MKSGVRKTLENILVGTLAAATIFTATACGGNSSSASQQQKPAQQSQPAITTPYTIQGQYASLGYGKDGKLVVVDVDGIGDKLYSYISGDSSNIASKVLTFDNYSVIIGGDKKGTGIGDYNFAAVSNNNSEFIGTAQNVGKLEILTINGNNAIIGWKVTYDIADQDKSNLENNPIMNAIARSLGYKNAGDTGKDDNDMPPVNIGTGVELNPVTRGKNTSYGAKVSVYKLNWSGTGPLEKIASQPLVLLRNSQIEEMTLGQDSNGASTLTTKYSWEANDGTRRYNTGTFNLDTLINAGVAQEGKVSPMLK